jgi:hypothetical protein
MDKIHIPKQITERFPYMFAGKNIGLSVPEGWCQTCVPCMARVQSGESPDTRYM